MKVKLLTRLAGPAGNYAAGSVIEVDTLTGEQLLSGRYAVSLEPEVEKTEELIIENKGLDIKEKPKKKR